MVVNHKIILFFIVCLLIVACDSGRKDKSSLCDEDNGCYNAAVLGELSKLCAYDEKCEVSIRDLVSDKKIDKVYLINKFGAHPHAGACDGVPTSSSFKNVAKFGCEYMVFSSDDEYSGYVVGDCDKSIVNTPDSDKIVFSNGFQYPAIWIMSDVRFYVEKISVDVMAKEGVTSSVDYYYLDVQPEKDEMHILKNECFHF